MLRSLRTAAGMTQEELAEAARVSYRSISDLERGVSRSPRRDTARLLADALSLSGDDRARFEAAARGRPPTTGHVVPPPLPGGIAAATRTLPRDIASFTGREPEIESILTAVAGAGAGGVVDICAIDGMAGIGKTALAVHAAHRLAGRFPDGQVFLQLHGHTPGHQPVDPADALASLLQVSGIPAQSIPDGLESRALLWRDRLAGRRVLLVLDNAAGSGQVAPLLPGDGGCLVLVTSRRHLGDLPGAVTPVLLDVLAPEQAARMFTRLAPRAAGSLSEVAEVVRLAGFLPLAISLLARLFARHRSWVLADLAAETRASLLTLTAEHDSVAAAFEVSYRHLGPARQWFFCLLGLHPGTTFEPYAAAALAGTSLDEAAGLLDFLHREGLVTETGHRRYGMHDLLRRYARDHAAAGPADGADLADAELSQSEPGEACRRLFDFYLANAEAADYALRPLRRPPAAVTTDARGALQDRFRGFPDALEWFDQEFSNLLACARACIDNRTFPHAWRLMAALGYVIRMRDASSSCLALLKDAPVLAGEYGDLLGAADVYREIGVCEARMTHYESARLSANRALSIYVELDDLRGQANVQRDLGHLDSHEGHHAAAQKRASKALAIYFKLGIVHGASYAHADLGVFELLGGLAESSRSHLSEALRISLCLGDRYGQFRSHLALGAALLRLREVKDAQPHLQQAQEISASLNNRLGQATSIELLGLAAAISGNGGEAEELWMNAWELYEEIGHSGAGPVLQHLDQLRLRGASSFTGDYVPLGGILW